MRKRILSICLSLFALLMVQVASAQTIEGLTSIPRAFKADEKITIVVDVSKFPGLKGEPGPFYIWTWVPNDPGNGTWDASSETMVMRNLGGTKWGFDMVPTQFYKVPAAQIKEIEFLVKSKNGTGDKKTSNLKLTPFDFNTAKGTAITTFPAKVMADENASIILDAEQVGKDGKLGTLVGEDGIYIWSGANGWKFGPVQGQGEWGSSSENTRMTNVGGNIWRIDLTPREFYGVSKSTPMTDIMMVFKNKSGSKEGKLQPGDKDVQVKVNEALTGPPPPRILSTIPSSEQEDNANSVAKFTGDDIITIVYNQKAERNPEMKKLKDVYIYTGINDGWDYKPTENWDDVTKNAKLKMKNNGDSTFMITMIPRLFYGVPSNVAIQRLNIIFRNAEGTQKSSGGDADNNFYVKLALPTGTADEIGKGFSVKQNFPNPFDQSTDITYSLAEAQEVSLVIYNIFGQEVRTLVSKKQNAGTYTATWNGDDEAGNKLNAGYYFYTIKAGDLTSTKKMVLVK